jgi:hypothetical protein
MISIIVVDWNIRLFGRLTRISLPDFIQSSAQSDEVDRGKILSEFGLKKRWWSFSHDLKKISGCKYSVLKRTNSSTVADSWLNCFDGECSIQFFSKKSIIIFFNPDLHVCEEIPEQKYSKRISSIVFFNR